MLPERTPARDDDVASLLLGRPTTVEYEQRVHDFVGSQRFLVTGAGGSIGSEIVRQLHHLGADSVHLLDHDESAMHALQLELVGHGLLDDDTTILADIRDARRINDVFADVRPDVVFHAAAHKHLPLLERYPGEGVKTNVFGSLNVVAAAVDCGASRFVNVSTDKAARPTSVLGASKRLAEKLVRDLSFTGATRVASVRFGNVLGSRGSFLPGLMSQIDSGREVTVTHADVTRFFMTIPEAAGLVVESAMMATEGETYVLDMGDPVRIMDLIERYVALRSVEAPSIAYSGLRPGEKLHEVLYDTDEVRTTTGHARIAVVRDSRGQAAVDQSRLDVLRSLAAVSRDSDAVRRVLFELVDPAIDLRDPQPVLARELVTESA